MALKRLLKFLLFQLFSKDCYNSCFNVRRRICIEETIKDYAYASTPNDCIQSGQSSAGINENADEKFLSIFPNPFISSSTIQTKGNLKNASLTIYNSNGQTLKQIKNISGQTVSLTRDNLPSGLYFMKLTEENKIIALEKLIITD